MKDTLIKKWPEIRATFIRSFKSSLHFSIATVSAEGRPHVAPFGSLMLSRDKPEGCYFEIFSKRTRTNLEENPYFCVLATDSSKWFWVKSMLSGRFKHPPALRLHGIASQRREATEVEIRRWRKQTRIFKYTKGYKFLWGKLKYVREVQFTDFEYVNLGKMQEFDK